MYILKFQIREIKTTAKGPHQENCELLTPFKTFYSNDFNSANQRLCYITIME